jgi:carboxymethylenebutenolidase
MGKVIQLTAADGHRFDAYRAEPAGKPKGGLIVVMEIFGANSHIRQVADQFAADGYLAIAPAFFDRAERNFESGYTPPEIDKARALMQKMNFGDVMKDVDAAMKNIASAGKTGIVGYCWGGSVAFKAACDIPGLACAVPYYGGKIPEMIGQQPKCPVQFHWGETDASIPLDKAKAAAAAYNQYDHFFYPNAGHGFNCDQRGSYNADAAKLARSRAMDFFAKHI